MIWSGDRIDGPGTIDFTRSFKIAGASAQILNTTLSAVGDTAHLTIAQSIDSSDDNGAIDNTFAGMISVDAPGQTLTVGLPLANQEKLKVAANTNVTFDHVAQLKFLNALGSRLSGGTWEVENGAVLELNNPASGAVTDIARIDAGAGVVLHGTGRVNNLPFQNNVHRFENAGTLELRDGVKMGSATVNGGVIMNRGEFLLDSTSSYETSVGGLTGWGGLDLATGTITERTFWARTGSKTTINGTMVLLLDDDPNGFASAHFEPGSILSGNGTINGHLVSEGHFNPGQSPGKLIVNGDYIQTASGVLEFEIGGSTTESYDQLIVNGTAIFEPGATVDVRFLPGTTIAAGTEFMFFDAETVTGDLSAVIFNIIGLADTALVELKHRRQRTGVNGLGGNQYRTNTGITASIFVRDSGVAAVAIQAIRFERLNTPASQGLRWRTRLGVKVGWGTHGEWAGHEGKYGIMEILIGIGSFVFALFITVLSVKLAAGWLDAEHNGWGRCAGALILAYVAITIAATVALVVGGMLDNIIGLVVVAVGLIVAIGAPIFIFARLLGTTGLQAFGILVIATVVNIAIWFGIVFVLAMVLGVGLAGLVAMLGAGALMPGGDVDTQAPSSIHDPVTSFTIGPCLSRLAPEDLEAYREMQAESGIPAEQLCNELEEPVPVPDLASGACLAGLADDERAAFGEMEMESGIPAEQLCRELTEDFDTTAASEPAADTAFSREDYYVMRDIAVADAGAHIGKLVRVTLGDGRRVSDQLVDFDGAQATLKRDKSEGGTRYSISVSEISRLEVFGR